jgi:hypothetical protein
MIIPNQDKVKRLLLLQLNAQVPEEEQKRNQATLSKQKNHELGMIVFMQPLQSVQMPIIKYKEFLCSLLTALLNQDLMLHRHWRINNLRIQRAKNYFCNVLHPFGTETTVFLLDDSKNIAMKPFFCCKGSNSIFWDSSSEPKWFFPWLWTLRWGRWLFTPSEPYKDPHHLKRFS